LFFLFIIIVTRPIPLLSLIIVLLVMKRDCDTSFYLFIYSVNYNKFNDKIIYDIESSLIKIILEKVIIGFQKLSENRNE